VSAALAALQGATISTLSLLAVFLGFSILFTLLKLRRAGHHAPGIRRIYLSPEDPHGTVDQLHTPELLETAARKSA
jgi:hypothetical protein